MPGSNSNLFTVDGQQAAATAVAAKRKEDDAAAAAQATVTTVHREQEALVAVVAAARKTLDQAWAREHADGLAWEKEKTIARHLEQQLAAAQEVVLPQDVYKRWRDLVLLTLRHYVLNAHCNTLCYG
jgi:phage/plasmid-associated DNA primase